MEKNKKIQYLKPSEIIPYFNNPRKNDEAVVKVAESIKAFGFQAPIIVDSNKVIIAGHTRWKAALKLELKEVPVIVADDLDDVKVKAYRIADNRVGEFAEWDWQQLEIEMADIGDKIKELFDFDFGKELESIEKIETIELKPFKSIHYLISTIPDNAIEVAKIIEKLNTIKDVEIIQASN